MTKDIRFVCLLLLTAQQFCSCYAQVENSPMCNYSGTYESGHCTCNPGHFGDQCECDAAFDDNSCRMTETSDICEGRGDCVCGVCDCHPVRTTDPLRRYSGRFCECDDYSCNYHKTMLCGGSSRGDCKCGQCVCKPGYTGEACGCTTSVASCRARNGKICNDHGTCRCGQCMCEGMYRGVTCSDCPTCPGMCEERKPCVQCEAFGTGALSEEQCAAECTHIELVDAVTEDQEWKLCRFRDEDNCVFYFSYHIMDYKIKVRRTKECPKNGNGAENVCSFNWFTFTSAILTQKILYTL